MTTPDWKIPRKSCTKCGLSKPVTQFWKQRDHADGYASACIACSKEAIANRPEQVWENRRSYSRAWKRAAIRLVKAHPKEFSKLMKEERQT